MAELNLIGQTLGRFEILTELGRGGMAVVYQARQTDLDRLVALKVLPPALTLDSSYVARFRQEARSVARLEHPHIMPIYEIGEADGLHYIAMKLIAGQTVKDLLHSRGSLPLDETITMIDQVGAALDYAHRQGVIHRDIKPSNMMITAEGWIYLTDFGLARGEGTQTGGLTLAGTVMGTPEYMSPEQAQGLATVGPSTDIYALGVVLYELLTGDFPFHADTPMGMLAARLLQAPIPPRDRRADLSPAVEDVIMRALARKPEARFPHAAALLEALREAAGMPATAALSPRTPALGVPALGATIKVATPPTPPVQPHAAPPPPPPVPPHATTPPAQLEAVTLPPPAVAPKRTHPLLIVLATIGGMALLCMALFAGLVMLGIMVDEGPDGRSPPPPRIELSAAFAEADTLLANPDGLLPALASYHDIHDRHPTAPEAQAQLAQAQLVAGRWDEAISTAEELSTNPDANPYLDSLAAAIQAEAHLALGDVTGATVHLEADTFVEPHPLYQASQAHWLAQRAVSIGDTNTLDEAFELLDEAEALLDDVDSDEDRLGVALSYAALGDTLALAAQLSSDDEDRADRDEYYAAAVELVPGATPWHRQQGYAYLADGDDDAARDAFNTALSQGDALAHAGLGWVAFAEGQLEQAEAAFDAAISEAPEADAGYFGKGYLRFAEEDFAAAAEAFALAAERNPSSATIQSWLGQAQFALGAATTWPDSRPALERAEAAFRQALASDDHSIMASAGLAWTLLYQERYPEAVEQFDTTITFDPYNASHYDGKGWSLFNQGLYAEAETSLRQALEQDATYVEALVHLGRTLEALGGRANEARDAYEQALSYDANHAEAQAGLARLR